MIALQNQGYEVIVTHPGIGDLLQVVDMPTLTALVGEVYAGLYIPFLNGYVDEDTGMNWTTLINHPTTVVTDLILDQLTYSYSQLLGDQPACYCDDSGILCQPCQAQVNMETFLNDVSTTIVANMAPFDPRLMELFTYVYTHQRQHYTYVLDANTLAIGT